MPDRNLRIVPATPDCWSDLVDLFGANGACAGCWCMFLRQSAREFDAGCRNGGAANRAALERLVLAGRQPGLLAYRNGTAVGWVSVGPRDDYPRILRSPVHKPDQLRSDVWSITCFYVAEPERATGVADHLLQAAIDHAAEQGAHSVEGYPTDTFDLRKPATEVWRGSLEQFERAGFEVILRRKPARPVVHRTLR